MKTKLILMMMLISLAGFRISTSRTITGTVSDAADKTALVGVSVTVQGTNIGVVTNVSGHYSINVPEGKTKLVFNYIGYISQTVELKKSNTINVLLKTSDKSLKEVVIGYNRSYSKGKASSSIINANDLEELQPTHIVQALQGRVAADVIEYRANAYPVRENATTDQILKKMPGVNVDAKGNVTAQGRQVVRVRGAAGNESYTQIIENPFTNPLNTPLSTFSVDVDAASYGNFRRYVNSGQLPPKNAVRIEEMINYFKYNLPQPDNGEPVAIHTELTAAPWNAQHRLLRIGLKAKNVEANKLPPSNLVFLLDVSGSMSDANKLPLVKASMKLLVDQLRAIDHVAIVVYAGDAGLKLPSTPGDQKTVIKDAIDALNAGGGTAGGAGLTLAYQVAREKFIKGGNNRIILATDGDFNVGASSDKDMEQLIAEERESGVSISILGFGMYNLKDSKMETMADKGHGNYAYIDNITEATKCMVKEFGGTLFTVAKDVKMQIEFNPAKVQAYRLLGYEDRLLNKEDFNNDKKLGGDMGVGHTVTALYEIIPAGVKDRFTDSVDPLKYQKTEQKQALNNSAEMVTVKFRYKEPDSDKSKMELVVVKDEPVALAKTSEDMRFAASVAELGLLLRDSEFKQQANFNNVVTMAKGAKGKDEEGYRAEFIRLAESAGLLYKGSQIVAENK